MTLNVNSFLYMPQGPQYVARIVRGVSMATRIHLFVFILAVVALSAVAQAQNNSGVESTVVYLSNEEAQFLKLINAFRAKLGLSELRIHAGLQAAAQKHSKWMAAQDLATRDDALSHEGPTPTTTFSDRIEQEGYANYTLLSENVACGSESAVGTFKQFALSPGHLANMISPRFRHIGIARAGNGNEICPYYWTTDFGSKVGPSTDAPAVTDMKRIATAIDEVGGSQNENGRTSLQILSDQMTRANERRPSFRCVIPYSMGRGVLVSSTNTQTTIDILPHAEDYMMKVSYQQDGTNTQFMSVTLSNAAVVKNAFYPVVSVFSAPGNRVGGFLLQIDLETGRGQFDPYPGYGGSSGMVSCSVKQ